MRAKEFILEGDKKPFHKSMKNASRNLTTYSALDNNNHPYLAYRFGIALAGSPDEDMHPEGPIGSNFHTIDYSDGDAEIRRGAEKVMGVKPSAGTGKKSIEMDHINVVSPVAQWNKKK